MNSMDRQAFYKAFRKQLRQKNDRKTVKRIWSNAGKEYDRIMSSDPALKCHPGAMVIPSAALYRALDGEGLDAAAMLNEYGDSMGEKYARAVHFLTGIPGVSRLLWKHIDSIMNKMSGEKLGYKRRIVSEPPEMYGVDILSCPYHDLAKQLGSEQAVLCICHMDKKYMKGFRCIRYERTTAVSEGTGYCDYRLRWDPLKK